MEIFVKNFNINKIQFKKVKNCYEQNLKKYCSEYYKKSKKQLKQSKFLNFLKLSK